MDAQQENDFLNSLKDKAVQSGQPEFGIAQRDQPPNYPTHYMAVALPDGRVGAWVAAAVDSGEAKAKCLEFAHRYPVPA